MRIHVSVFWVFDQDTDLHVPLQGLGRLLNLDIETRDIVYYSKFDRIKVLFLFAEGAAYLILNILR